MHKNNKKRAINNLTYLERNFKLLLAHFLLTRILIMELLPKSILGLQVKFLNYESERLVPISLQSKKEEHH